jgi:sterol desaturase/sphingolipid hydroxylase (fatty acid hydroxylase superfamily)
VENRLIIFLTVLALFIFLENIFKIRKQNYKKRIIPNLSLVFISSLILKLAFPFGLVALLIKINQDPTTLALSQLPLYLELPITLIVFDLIIYWQHRLFHVIPYLWNMHIIHHSDRSMDTTTALRFHPFEILISGLIKLIFISLLAPRAESFLTYEILLSSFAIFNHSNFKIPKKLDNLLRIIIVTPSFHSPHHSPEKRFTNSNYGNFLSLWDRIFGSYTPEINSIFGIKQLETDNLFLLLKYPLNSSPFKKKD